MRYFFRFMPKLNSNLVFVDIENSMIVYVPETGRISLLNPQASRVLSLCDGRTPVSTAIDMFAAEGGVAADLILMSYSVSSLRKELLNTPIRITSRESASYNRRFFRFFPDSIKPCKHVLELQSGAAVRTYFDGRLICTANTALQSLRMFES